MFVHFGLYSLLEAGEWTYKLHRRDVAEYKKLMEKFNPGDMGKLVREIKKSGAKYIPLTARHHDGFSLFDACRKEDIVPFFYHTIKGFRMKCLRLHSV